ncbi:MAG TPA: hypothetical protein DIC49_04850 [Gammaproteobacteria bacterium]|nr:hypothetical protein [Gammaproteobacteria bacterium]|tara:strand:- start:251 stop:673 length:423 start_codon:yes stop_codon:yes gene_type:complete
MFWLISVALLVLVTLGWYAWSLIRKLKTIERKREQLKRDALLGIQILVDSYLDEQVDRSECLLRIRVLLDAHSIEWSSGLQLGRFDEISNVILSMPFGEARQQMDVSTRREHDAVRRQLLQIHEVELKSELELLKEWLDK